MRDVFNLYGLYTYAETKASKQHLIIINEINHFFI